MYNGGGGGNGNGETGGGEQKGGDGGGGKNDGDGGGGKKEDNKLINGSADPSQQEGSDDYLAAMATATLVVIKIDIATPDPTDAAWFKWATYAVAGTAAAVYLANNESDNNFYYVTYIKTNAAGQVYVGRASGFGSPYSAVKQRDSKHNMPGYGPAVLTSSARAMFPGGYSSRDIDPSYFYIRGSEQVQMEYYRKLGILSPNNRRNGISPTNRNVLKYLDSFTKYKF